MRETADVMDHWDAREYVEYYYGVHKTVPKDEEDMFRFYAAALRAIGRHLPSALEIGCGPVLHRAAQTVRWTDRLDMADFNDDNLRELRMWLENDPKAFDWSVYIGGKNGVVDIEGDGGTLAEREQLLRSRVHLMNCDLNNEQPLGKPASYPLVSCHYCAEWVIPNPEGYKQTLRRLSSLVEPGGWLLLSGVHDTEWCMVNNRPVHCARIRDTEIRSTLESLGYTPSTIRIDVTPGLRPEESGIRGTFMAHARK
jgi:hypothetical protein